MRALTVDEVATASGGVNTQEFADGLIAFAEGAAIALAPEVSIPLIVAGGVISGGGLILMDNSL